MKDPILETYTLEELAYEYYMINEREVARQEQVQEKADKIEEERHEADLAWADEEEARERAELEAQAAKEAEKKAEEQYDPTKDPKNIEWMEKEIEKSKLVFGEDFGENLSLDFDGDD